MNARAFLCTESPAAACDRPSLPTEQRALTPWIDRWTPGDGRKIWINATVPRAGSVSFETIDAREWIETMHDERRWPPGTCFEVVTEATS
jgi:hypothetical protein